jgi:uncharacterized repeat protein (TIGR01451 family)
MTPTLVPTLVFIQQVSNSNPSPGTLLTYTLSITITGSSAGAAAVTDILPSGLTFVQFTPGDPAGEDSGQTLIWDLSNLSPGNYTLSFNASLGNGVSGGTTLVNQGEVYLDSTNAQDFASSAITILAWTPTPTWTASTTPTSTPTATPTHTPVSKTGVVIFPNPSTGTSVTIQLSLASSASQVRIEIFTLAFRRVNQITLSAVPAGIKDVTLSLTDRDGTPLANGLYFVVVNGDGQRTIEKLLILR